MTVVRSITVRQPWASCIASSHADAKRVENRGRPTSYRGPIAIHAARTADTAADTDPRITGLFGPDPRLGRPVGAVIAVADLADCHQATLDWADTADPRPCCTPWGERWYNGAPAWHLVLANVRVLDTPVPARGQIGVPWNLPADVAAQVNTQLAAVTR